MQDTENTYGKAPGILLCGIINRYRSKIGIRCVEIIHAHIRKVINSSNFGHFQPIEIFRRLVIEWADTDVEDVGKIREKTKQNFRGKKRKFEMQNDQGGDNDGGNGMEE